MQASGARSCIATFPEMFSAYGTSFTDEYPGALYYVTSRGNAGKKIVRSDKDRVSFHKLITAARRPGEAKRSKDLEQCAVIAPRLDQDMLDDVRRSVKLSSRTWVQHKIIMRANPFSTTNPGNRRLKWWKKTR